MPSTDENRATLETYNKNVQNYVDNTADVVDGQYKTWIDLILTHITAPGSILELGSATGRDADYIESHGYHIQRTDATEGFVKRLQSAGVSARKLDAIHDEFGGPYDLIFANAVFLHFTHAQLKEILEKAYHSIAPDGVLAFSVKLGSGEGWETNKLGDPRYFSYWTLETMGKLLEGAHFAVVASETGPSSRPGIEWLRIIARKLS